MLVDNKNKKETYTETGISVLYKPKLKLKPRHWIPISDAQSLPLFKYLDSVQPG